MKDPNKKINFWKILKELIGKDLTKISLPVYFNEPLSMTQRVAESTEYCDQLLERAALETDPLLRLAIVSTFNMTRN